MCVYKIANEATTQSSVNNNHHHYLDADFHLYIFTQVIWLFGSMYNLKIASHHVVFHLYFYERDKLFDRKSAILMVDIYCICPLPLKCLENFRSQTISTRREYSNYSSWHKHSSWLQRTTINSQT